MAHLEAFRTPDPIGAILAGVRLGAPQSHREIVVWPLFKAEDDGPPYKTMREAVRDKNIRIYEIPNGGCVSQVCAANTSSGHLLILDGEEMVGACQNRAVNTTLLLPGNSETDLPVTCTEQGRWREVSKAFGHSEAVMEMNIRRSKTRSVTDSLRIGRGHRSAQCRLWEEIEMLQAKAGHRSPTSAMLHVFQAQGDDLRKATEALPCQPGQHGLLVAFHGRVAGFDVVSRSSAYARLHDGLVRSYALSGLVQAPEHLESPSERDPAEFIRAVGSCARERFPSIGLGESWRLDGDGIIGAGLVLDGVVIHLSAFRENRASASTR